MADRLTAIHLPGVPKGYGLAHHGRSSAAAMVDAIRHKARQELDAAQAILAAKPEDFRVETYLGVYRRRQIEVLQEGKAL